MSGLLITGRDLHKTYDNGRVRVLEHDVAPVAAVPGARADVAHHPRHRRGAPPAAAPDRVADRHRPGGPSSRIGHM